MEDAILHTFNLVELNTLPELFEQPEELYIMLLDYIYTDRYNCQQQYDAIIQYCTENNYLVDTKAQLSMMNNTMQSIQFVHAILSIIVTLVSKKKYEQANEFAVALKNDITTQIQDYHLTELIKKRYNIHLNVNKIFNKKLANIQLYINTITMITSITYEGINDYETASQIVTQLQEKDVSFALSFLRLKFNAVFSFNNQFYTPFIEQIQSSFQELQQLCIQLQTKQYANNFFNYDKRLIQYISKLYEARINSLLNQNEKANQIFSELWSLAPDEESYEESISIYLDNFVRYALPVQKEINLITLSPMQLLTMQSRQNIVDQAISIAIEFSQQQEKPGVQAVSMYYLGVFMILKKDLKQALEYMKLAKKLNNQVYKYPSEMVILTWLPQMIDFDILCLMMLLNDQELSYCNTKDYFEKLITKKSILLKLSPDRKSVCMANQVLMEFQIFIHSKSTEFETLLSLLTKTGMIDEKFGSSANMQYIEQNECNIYILTQIYLLGMQIFEKCDSEVSDDCKSQLRTLVKDNKPFLNFVESSYLSQNAQMLQKFQKSGPKQQQSTSKSQKQSFNFANIKTKQELSQQMINQLGGQMKQNYELQIYQKVLQQNNQLESAFNLLKDDQTIKIVNCLFQLYRKQNLDDLFKLICQELVESSYGDQSTNKVYLFTVIKSLILYQQNNTSEAIVELQKFIAQIKPDQQVTFLLQHLIAKLLFKQNKYDESSQLLLQLKNQSNNKFNSLSIDYDLALINYHNNDLDGCLAILENITDPFSQFVKFNILLNNFKNQLTFEQILPLLQQVFVGYQLNDLDQAIISCILLYNQFNNQQDENLQQLLINNLIQQMINNVQLIQQIYAQNTRYTPQLNQFFIYNFDQVDHLNKQQLDQLYSVLQPEISQTTLFLSEYYNNKLIAHFLLNMLIVGLLLQGQEANLQFQLFESFVLFNPGQLTLPNCYIQNYIIFALKCNNPDLLENVLSFASSIVKQQFLQQINQSEIDISDKTDIKLKQISVQLNNQQYNMHLIAPIYQFTIPDILNEQSFNLINQFVFPQFLESENATYQEVIQMNDLNNEISPNCVFQKQFSHLQLIQQQYSGIDVAKTKKTDDEGFLNVQEQDAKRRIRAPSARPCLRINKAKLNEAQNERKPPKQLRRFKEQ